MIHENKILLVFAETYQKWREVAYKEMSTDNDQKGKKISLYEISRDNHRKSRESLYMEMSLSNDQKRCVGR